jgi:hypothetical protein
VADVPLGVFEFEELFTPTGTGETFDFDSDAAGGIFRLLAGTSTEFVAIWAESDASQTNARFQVASTGTGAALSVIDIAASTLYDFYTTTVSGRASEALESENIIDLVTV